MLTKMEYHQTMFQMFPLKARRSLDEHLAPFGLKTDDGKDRATGVAKRADERLLADDPAFMRMVCAAARVRCGAPGAPPPRPLSRPTARSPRTLYPASHDPPAPPLHAAPRGTAAAPVRHSYRVCHARTPCGCDVCAWRRRGGGQVEERGKAAKEEKVVEMRIDPSDGKPYNMSSFLAVYGGLREWKSAPTYKASKKKGRTKVVPAPTTHACTHAHTHTHAHMPCRLFRRRRRQPPPALVPTCCFVPSPLSLSLSLPSRSLPPPSLSPSRPWPSLSLSGLPGSASLRCCSADKRR